VAPGEGVFSCVMGGGYEPWDGTSMATPIVSGIAALLIEKYRDMTVSDLQEAILNSCKDLGLPPQRQGHGLVQANIG
jgi:subtilisin family serine protease